MPTQIAREVRTNNTGTFSDTFGGAYDMTDIVFSIGHTAIAGRYSCNISEKDGVLSISGKIYFNLEDKFEDPLDIFDSFSGNIDLLGAAPYRIYDSWQGQFNGQIYADASLSSFR